MINLQVIELSLTIIGIGIPIGLGIVKDIQAHKTLKGRVSSIENTISSQTSHLDALDKDIQLLGTLLKK